MIKQCRGMEQSVARRAHNPKVVGSSPTPATTEKSVCNRRSFVYTSKLPFFVPQISNKTKIRQLSKKATRKNVLQILSRMLYFNNKLC